jgi:hypothetical protein
MPSVKLAIACLGSFACATLCFGQAAKVRDAAIPNPVAIATNADVLYCLDRVRGLDPERVPQAYLVAQVRVRVSYRNPGTRALIVPLERERTIYDGFSPEAMNVVHEQLDLFHPSLKPMKNLPEDVGPDSPIDPKNDVFTVIPAGGEMPAPLQEEVTLPVNRKGVLRQYPDLRGHKVFVKLRFVHRDLTAGLKAELSDRWSRFGVPWTGTLTTNAVLIDIPAAPQAAPCVDIQTPAHPVKGLDDTK